MRAFHQQISKEMPALQRYARRLCAGAAWSEDLAQDTLAAALALEDSFSPGTNMRAWLFTLLKHRHLNECRKRRRRASLLTEYKQAAPVDMPPQIQEVSLALVETRTALENLPDDQRAALLLVAVDGATYEEAAQTLDEPVSSLRSKLWRARRNLIRHLQSKPC